MFAFPCGQQSWHNVHECEFQVLWIEAFFTLENEEFLRSSRQFSWGICAFFQEAFPFVLVLTTLLFTGSMLCLVFNRFYCLYIWTGQLSTNDSATTMPDSLNPVSFLSVCSSLLTHLLFTHLDKNRKCQIHHRLWAKLKDSRFSRWWCKEFSHLQAKSCRQETRL